MIRTLFIKLLIELLRPGIALIGKKALGLVKSSKIRQFRIHQNKNIMKKDIRVNLPDFQLISQRVKKFHICRNVCNLQAGDIVRFLSYDVNKQWYTGGYQQAWVTSIFDVDEEFNLKEGLIAFDFEII